MTHKGRFARTGNSKRIPGADSGVDAFLSFIERDSIDNPESIQPMSPDFLARAARLVSGLQVNLDEPIDDDTLRARGARSDAYAGFQRMLEAGAPPGDWDELLAQSEGLELPGE